MVIEKLSDKAKEVILDDLNPRESVMVLMDLSHLADHLDARGFYDAADEVDNLIHNQIKKLAAPGRMEAKNIRTKLSK